MYEKIIIIIGFLVIIFIAYLLIHNYIETYENDDKKIDIVITWVESDKNFEKDKEYWLNKENYKYILTRDDYKRYVEHQELKYLLRSIEEHFPHYNNIYLVVRDGQFPNYLKKDHPNLKVIKHSEIIPKKYLPTFNPFAIECYLHHIPNLTDNYLYINDDIMFLKDLKPSYFIENNLPVCLYNSGSTKSSFDKKTYSIDPNLYDFKSGLILNNFILDDIIKQEERYNSPPHLPKIYNKSFDYDIEKRLKDYYINDDKINVYDKTGSSKFRKNYNLYLVTLLKDSFYTHWFSCKYKASDMVFLELDDENKKLDEPINLNKHFLCMQEIGSQNIDKYYKFMDKLFPKKSSFEI